MTTMQKRKRRRLSALLGKPVIWVGSRFSGSYYCLIQFEDGEERIVHLQTGEPAPKRKHSNFHWSGELNDHTAQLIVAAHSGMFVHERRQTVSAESADGCVMRGPRE